MTGQPKLHTIDDYLICAKEYIQWSESSEWFLEDDLMSDEIAGRQLTAIQGLAYAVLYLAEVIREK